MRTCCPALVVALLGVLPVQAAARSTPIVGLIPKAARPIKMDGKLDGWEGAFITPVHVGHPDFANRGGQFLFLWDEHNLYIGLRCLDQKIAHVAPDNQIYNGDAVEFYLDTRRGDQLGAAQFTPGTLHMFWTGFTGTKVKPRMQVRNLPVFRDFKLKGAEVAAVKTPWGYTAEFKLPWANFLKFTPKIGEEIGIDCELCSSDGGPRVDRTFVYSSPSSVSTPATFGRVKLVDKIDPGRLGAYGQVLLPLSLTRSANYPWLYGTVGISPTIEKWVVRLEGKILDSAGKVRKSTAGTRQRLEGSGFPLWKGSWELFDLPAGLYTLEFKAFGKDNQLITGRSVSVLHGTVQPAKPSQNPSPMIEKTRVHPRLKQERPQGRREKLTTGELFLPEGLPQEGRMPLLIHFHGATWIPQVAASQNHIAVISVQLGSGSAVYGRAFADPKALGKLLEEAEKRAGIQFGPVGLSAWSAGYGAVRAILKVRENFDRVQSVLLIDGLHAGYMDGRPGPRESKLVADDLEVFVRYARAAAAGKKQMIISHSEVFPGTFASTTETADYLLDQLRLQRQATLKWGPAQMQQLSEAGKGKLRVVGYAGNSAPDHIDQLHGLPEFLKWISWK
jgi:hypothetical protein